MASSFASGGSWASAAPGLLVLLPFVDRLVRLDLRTVTIDVPSQDILTRDNVTVRVNAVVYFRVVRPIDAAVAIADHVRATSQIAQTTLRSVIGTADFDDLLAEREQLNERLQRLIDEETDPWGVKVSAVELKDVGLREEMHRGMAAQAEAERTRRAKVIAAEGEFQASDRLREAADVMAAQPVTLQLRYLQTLGDVAREQPSTTVFPLPMSLLPPKARKRRPTGDEPGADR